MPSFLIRGLARYAAASAMAGGSNSSTDFDPDYATVYISKAVSSWRNVMRWLLPFTQATGYRIVIENPKSHQQIIIDQHTRRLPRLTSRWLRRYDKQDLREFIAIGKEKKKARRIAEARGRAKFGKSYIPAEKDIQDALNNM